MARLTVKPGAQRRLEQRMLGRVKRDVAEPIQTEVVRLNASEAVDTGLMTASWRIAENLHSVTVGNTAFSEDKFPYPRAIEGGFRHHQSGQHIPARRLLARAIDIAQHLS